jgi:alanine dehydrogenase
VRRNASLRRAVNTYRGAVVHEAVGTSLGLPWTPLESLLGA